MTVPALSLLQRIAVIGVWGVASLAMAVEGAKPAPATIRAKVHALSLLEMIDLAFAQNPDLAAAEARMGQAEARVAEVAAGFYPQLTARVGYDYTNNPALAFA